MIYLLGGENVYESLKRLDELKQDFEKSSDATLRIINADEMERYEEILESAESLSLFYTKQLLIIKRLFSTKSHVVYELSDYIISKKNINDDIIFWEDKPFDKRKRLFKYIKQKGIVEEFPVLRYTKLKSWISSYIKKQIDFDSHVIDLILLKIGNDQMQMALTLDNLITLVKSENRKKLIEDDVRKFVAKTAEESIWDFIDSIGEYDKAKALRIIEDLLFEKKDFVIIAAMLARQFRILVMVKYLLEKGTDYSDIINILKLHPFVVRKAIAHSKNFSMERLKKLYEKLVKTDLAVKEGRFDEKLALDLLIAAL